MAVPHDSGDIVVQQIEDPKLDNQGLVKFRFSLEFFVEITIPRDGAIEQDYLDLTHSYVKHQLLVNAENQITHLKG